MGHQLHTAVVGKLDGDVGELATLEQLSVELGGSVDANWWGTGLAQRVGLNVDSFKLQKKTNGIDEGNFEEQGHLVFHQKSHLRTGHVCMLETKAYWRLGETMGSNF
jgi:hypothetical protein